MAFSIEALCSFIPMLRLLIIEDDAHREVRLRSWLPMHVRSVVARSAGAAIGILRRDLGRFYMGILLDHDLYTRPATETDRYLTGNDLVDVIAECVSRDTAILVHSANASQRARMVHRLRTAGFEVSQIPMDELTQEAFVQWLQEVCRQWRETE